jgi:hypothetical protein
MAMVATSKACRHSAMGAVASVSAEFGFVPHKIRGGGAFGSVEGGVHGKGRDARRSLARGGGAWDMEKTTKRKGEAAPLG